MATYFTYLLRWTQHDKSYYGVRFCRNCSPTSLWTTYFSSSTYVQQFRAEYGDPDVIEIRKTFTDKHEAMMWEHRVLSRLHVPNNVRWLNKNAGKNPMTVQEHRDKLSATRIRLGHGIRSAQYLKPHIGKDNPMCDPVILAKYKQGITGRKRKYHEDGSWSWYYP